jgi:phosphoglycerol transferase MdoB-like AlkP superfamily enzyme
MKIVKDEWMKREGKVFTQLKKHSLFLFFLASFLLLLILILSFKQKSIESKVSLQGSFEGKLIKCFPFFFLLFFLAFHFKEVI